MTVAAGGVVNTGKNNYIYLPNFICVQKPAVESAPGYRGGDTLVELHPISTTATTHTLYPPFEAGRVIVTGIYYNIHIGIV